jgi:hypothetical protein
MFSAVSHFRNVRPWLTYIQSVERFLQLDEIAADPKADFEEKKRMMEMLKRFEDAQAEGEDGALYMTLVISAYPLL